MLDNKKKKLIQQIAVMVFIFSLLFVITVLSIRNVKTSSRNREEIANVKTIRDALSYYFYIYNRFPDSPTPEECGDYKGNISGCCFSSELGFNKECKGTIYFRSVAYTPEGKSYVYLAGEDNADYKLNYSILGELKGFREGANTATANTFSQ